MNFIKVMSELFLIAASKKNLKKEKVWFSALIF